MSIEEVAKIFWQGNVPVNSKFDDPYFSLDNGEEESKYVFLSHNNLPKAFLDKPKFVIAETGFGTGLNFLVTAQCWLENRKENGHLTYFSVEKYPIQKKQLYDLYRQWPQFKHFTEVLIKQYPENIPGFHHITFKSEQITLVLMIGDVCEMLDYLTVKVDAWYLDGFAPSKNEEMWSIDVFRRVVSASQIGTTFATFTAAGSVRRNLQTAGFDVKKVKGFGKKREMLCGELSREIPLKLKAPWFTIQKQKSITPPVAIIGAGIAGLSCALALAEQGIESIVIDSGESVGTGASGNPAGIVLPKINLDFESVSQFYVSSFEYAINFYNELKQHFPQLQWTQNGVLQIETEDRIAKFSAMSLPNSLMTIVDPDQVSKIAGLPCEQSALYFPSAGVINPLQLCEIMSSSVGAKQTTLFRYKVDSLEKLNTEWLLKSKDNNIICCVEKVIIANSFDASRLLQSNSLTLATNRGQLSYLPISEVSAKLRTAICGDGYLIPAENNLHVIGATYGGDEKTLKRKDHEKNWFSVNSLVPDCLLDHSTIQAGRVSYRSTTKDHLPIVGPVIDEEFYGRIYSDLHFGRTPESYPTAQYIDGLYLNVGHGSRGLVSCIATARYLTSLISGAEITESSNVVELLHPGRFLVRAFKKNQTIG